MKKTIQLILVIAVASACSTTNRVVNSANRHYDNMEYYLAAQQYSRCLQGEKGHKVEMRLAECYLHMNHFEEAEKAFATAFKYTRASTQNMLQYAHVLKHNGKYDEAKKWYVEYLLDTPADAAVSNELRSCDSLINYTRATYEYSVGDAGFNGGGSNFSPVFYRNGIVFCSERTKASRMNEISKWTGRTYLDLYFSEVVQEEAPGSIVEAGKITGPIASNDNGAVKKISRFSEPKAFSEKITSTLNEGPACFNKEGTVMYFTRNILNNNSKPEKNATDVNNFEIYRSFLNENTWSKPVLLSFDNKEYSVGHPALSKDEKRLYFVSDKPGGSGGTDIYYSELVNENWSEPVNAGALINSSENEMFPVVHVDEKGNEFLYFSSEGHPGMGGLDIYFVEIKNGWFSKPVHLNAPLNSSADDFGIIFSADGLTGYFSSNRDEADGTDKVFSFKKYVPEFYMDIKVIKKGVRVALANAAVEIEDVIHAKKEILVTDENGRVTSKIEPNSNFIVTIRKDNFFAASCNLSNVGKIFSDTLKHVVELEAIVINKPIRLDNIYYDYDKWDIRADASSALDTLVKIMRDNPAITIELSSHTDCRGNDSYNMKLSQKRAEAVVNYIISQNISAERIYAKGYGESKLLNHCSNESKCEESDHQVNRRTEFKVVSITDGAGLAKDKP